MTTPKHEQKSGWRRAAGACSAVLITAACSPAGTTAPPPASAPAPTAAPAPADVPPEVVAAPIPAAPVAPTESGPVAPPPVVVRVPAPATPPVSPPSPPAPVLPTPSATVTPVRAGLPAGPGRETVQQVCTGCHAIGMVTANGRTSDGWAEMIERMMGLGMEASDEDLQTVHAYLTREFPPRRAN